MKNADNKHDNRHQSVFEQKASLFQSISLTPNNWIWEVDINGVYTYCSNGVFDIFGYLPEEIIGKKPSDFLSPEDGVLVRTHFQQAILKQQPIKNLEIPTHSKDGNFFVFEVNGVPYFNDKGELIGYRGINHDITKRIQAETKLSKDRLMLKTLLESIPDLIWLKDTEGVYLACNPKFERLCGANEADIIGKTDYDFAPKELADSFRLKDKEAIAANKATVNLEWVTYADDGHVEFIETIKTPMYDTDGNLTGILGIARDITKHKEILEALNESKSRLTVAMNIARLGTWEYDIVANKFMPDDQYYAIFGTSFDEQGPIESVEHLFKVFIHPDDIERVDAEVRKAILTPDPNETFKVEHRFIHSNGETKYVLACFIVLKDENGFPLKIYGVNQDITNVKKAELELQELNASKD
jgi:PAS domain S-box-containing protein